MKKGNGLIYWAWCFALWLCLVLNYAAFARQIAAKNPNLGNELPDSVQVKKWNERAYLAFQNYPDSTEWYSKQAMNLARSCGYFKGLAEAYKNLGLSYKARGNYPLALQWYYRSLHLFDSIWHKPGMMKAYNSIGVAFYNQKDYPKAIYNYQMAYELAKGMDLPNVEANALNNMGIVLKQTMKFDSAMQLYKKAEILAEKHQIKPILVQVYINEGNVMAEWQKWEEALVYYQKALDLAKSEENAYHMAALHGNVGNVLMKLDRWEEAKVVLKLALEEAEKLNAPDLLADFHDYLRILCLHYKRYEEAYFHLESCSRWKDTLLAEDNIRKGLEAEFGYKLEREQLTMKAEQDKKDAIAAVERKKQALVLGFVLMVLVLVVIFSVLLYKRFKVTMRQKKIIEVQRNYAEQQKNVIEQKQKEIIDSINYAHRIQQAVMKEDKMERKDEPEYFIFSKPKDIVSGDFFWTMRKNQYWYAAVADCTGHGVPGAFMSMLGMVYLNELAADERCHEPAEILNWLRDRIIHELGTVEGKKERQDGMDISLLRLDLESLEVQWAGANNAMYYMPFELSEEERRKGLSQPDLMEFKADKQPVGLFPDMKPFSQHQFTVKRGDVFYLFTDGFADQFGGEKGKKYNYKRFESLLMKLDWTAFKENKGILSEQFESWKGELDQLDDVMIMGIKLIT